MTDDDVFVLFSVEDALDALGTVDLVYQADLDPRRCLCTGLEAAAAAGGAVEHRPIQCGPLLDEKQL